MEHITGLYNYGNTCYISSAVQCLLNLEPFVLLTLDLHSDNGLVLTFKEFVQKIRENHSNIDKIWRSLLLALHDELKTRMTISKQNDIEEFIIIFLDHIHENTQSEFQMPDVCKKVLSKKSKQKKSIANVSGEQAHDLAIEIFQFAMRKWKSHFEKDFSAFVNLFNWCIISQINCTHCQKKHTTHEFPNCLQLEITDNLHASIRSYLSPLKLNLKNDDHISWKCDACKSTPVCKKVFVICTFPKILMISLKRFQFTNYGGFVKNNDNIDIPLLLELDEFEVIPYTLPKMAIFELLSVACHSGGLRGGHYYCIIKKSDTWFKVNDDYITKIDDPNKAKRIIDASAYMLFYKVKNV